MLPSRWYISWHGRTMPAPGHDDLAAEPVLIRRAGPGDAVALGRLAALDDAPRLRGDVLLAEVGGELRAALSLDDGRAISDPFRPSAQARELLLVRAGLLERAALAA